MLRKMAIENRLTLSGKKYKRNWNKRIHQSVKSRSTSLSTTVDTARWTRLQSCCWTKKMSCIDTTSLSSTLDLLQSIKILILRPFLTAAERRSKLETLSKLLWASRLRKNNLQHKKKTLTSRKMTLPNQSLKRLNQKQSNKHLQLQHQRRSR